jgi:hypothetical protein
MFHDPDLLCHSFAQMFRYKVRLRGTFDLHS